MHFRIFLASPGDVAQERALAHKVIDDLHYDVGLRGLVTLEIVAWDKPGASTPMLATMTPQEAIVLGLRKPSECDVVVVVFWSRMGTPLSAEYCKPDGSGYLSGTDWEYHNALEAARRHNRPEILLYRRTEKCLLDPSDQEFKHKLDQWEKVQSFFLSFQNTDGSLRAGYNSYGSPDQFAKELDAHLKSLIHRRLKSRKARRAVEASRQLIALPLWKGSPFPGLRPFTADDAPIFFGRGREIDGLVGQLSDSANRFLAVVGASGSGKSSLVAAGLLPSLQENAVPGSRDWLWASFKPGERDENPFAAIAAKLMPLLKMAVGDVRDVACTLSADPSAIVRFVDIALDGKPDWAELILFIDQFEELFTLVTEAYREPFVAMLRAAAEFRRTRVVATIRADFYARCVELPELARLLRSGSYPLAAPGVGSLFEMIEKPAARAGLELEAGLTQRILNDTGAEPGALTLMAFALSALYDSRTSSGRLTNRSYDSFDGVRGAIAKRAEEKFLALDAGVQAALGEVFKSLVQIDESGAATRRRVALGRLSRSSAASSLVDALTEARLLVRSSDERGEPVVEVAHEALFASWPRLARWIAETRDDLRLLQLLSSAAAEWERQGHKEEYLWPQRRMAQAYDVIARLQPELNQAERRFLLLLDQDGLLGEITDISTPHQRRAAIGDRLGELGDTRPGVGLRGDGVPNIVWCEIGACEVYPQDTGETVSIQPFRIARYLTTWAQYLEFLQATDGYSNASWWDGLVRDELPGDTSGRASNRPAEFVSWYDAIAFCRWLSCRLGFEVRLPDEWEWEAAATIGDTTYRYPWGTEWDGQKANTEESGLNRTTAVGMYPSGASRSGLMDLSGNVWEWCSNEYASPFDVQQRIDHAHGIATPRPEPRAVRGGGWSWDHASACVTRRERDLPDYRSRDHGFRVASGFVGISDVSSQLTVTTRGRRQVKRRRV
jgi:hypothetical protein